MMNCMKPDISVIIAAHNAERFLWETLASLQRQFFTNFEIIVVDDGSIDGTRNIASRPHVTLISIPQSGVSEARNVGLRAARGSAVLFLDADDLMPPDALLWLWNGLDSNPSAPAIVGQHLKFWTDSEEPHGTVLARGSSMPERHTLKALLQRNFVVNGGTILIRREAARATNGFNPKLRLGEDWDFWCRLALLGDFALLRDRIVLHYRQRLDGAQNTLRGTALSVNDEAVISIFSHPLIRQRLSPRELWLSRRFAQQDAYWSEARAHFLRRNWLSFATYIVIGMIRYPETPFRIGQLKRYWRGASQALTALKRVQR